MNARRLLVGVAACALACTPPEQQRVQGGGRAADIGNRGEVVELHAGSQIYPDRRCAVQGVECHGPPPVSGRGPERRQLSEHVLEHMRRGGRVRPVIYTPPPDLAHPDPAEMELPFPGPEVPVEPPDPDDDEAPPAAAPDTVAGA